MVQVLNVRASIQLFFTLIILVSLGVLTFNLGLWQQNRAAQKIILDEQQRRAVQLPVLSLNETFVSPRAFNHRLLELNGRWVDDAVVYIDNRQIQGNPAVQVIQGFQPTGYNFLIPIDRGYLLRNPNNPRLAPEQPKSNVPTTGPVTVIIQVLDGFSRSAELRRFFSTNQAKTEPAFFENVNTPEGLRMSGYANQNSDQIVQSVSNGYLVWSNFDMQVFEQKTQRPMSSFVGRIHHQFDSNPVNFP